MLIAISTPATAALVKASDGVIPVVFSHVSDPVGMKFVDSLERPGRNVTGFSNFEASLGGKWLQLLLQVAPRVTRMVASLRRRCRGCSTRLPVGMRPRLPAYTQAGGLIAYTLNEDALYVGAGDYAGRILNGARPQNLPVQAPTRFDLIINLKTAAAQGLAVPPDLLVAATRVIE